MGKNIVPNVSINIRRNLTMQKVEESIRVITENGEIVEGIPEPDEEVYFKNDVKQELRIQQDEWIREIIGLKNAILRWCDLTLKQKRWVVLNVDGIIDRMTRDTRITKCLDNCPKVKDKTYSECYDEQKCFHPEFNKENIAMQRELAQENWDKIFAQREKERLEDLKKQEGGRHSSQR